MFDYHTMIDGAAVEPGEVAHQTVNPARPSEQVGAYTLTTPDQLARAIASATKAQQAWARVPGVERGQIVEAYLRAVLARKDDVARAVTLEQGKPLREASTKGSLCVARLPGAVAMRSARPARTFAT